MLYERYLRAYEEQFRKTDRNMWNYEDGCVLIGLRALYLSLIHISEPTRP